MKTTVLFLAVLAWCACAAGCAGTRERPRQEYVPLPEVTRIYVPLPELTTRVPAEPVDAYTAAATRKAAVAEARAAGRPIVITRLDHEIDSAGGVTVRLSWVNASPTKTVKYAYFEVEPYNAVGDFVYCTITGHVKGTLKDTGPVAPAQYDEYCEFEGVWYNYSVTCVKLTHLALNYMDGSELTMSEEGQIAELFAPTSKTQAARTCPPFRSTGQ